MNSRTIDQISRDELRTVLSLYELVCHLVHLNDQFLSQFCDAVAILGVNHLLVNFLTNGKYKKAKIRTVKRHFLCVSIVSDNNVLVRLANLILSLLCCALRELPENAGLVEKIIFSPKVNIVSLMKNNSVLLK